MFHTLVVIARRVTHRRAFLPSPALFRRLPALHFCCSSWVWRCAFVLCGAERRKWLLDHSETQRLGCSSPRRWSAGLARPGDVLRPSSACAAGVVGE